MEQNKDKIERRQLLASEMIVQEESRTVEGYALLFDTPSDGLSFEEIIARGALDGVIEKSNVFAYLDHDYRRGVLARSIEGKGTLALTIDTKGLKYRFDAPKTALGDELLEHLRLGNIEESSFAFTVAEETWEMVGDDNWKRTISKIDQLYDVSPVFDGAYSKTSVYTRGREAIENKLLEERKRELDAYYQDLNKNFN